MDFTFEKSGLNLTNRYHLKFIAFLSFLLIALFYGAGYFLLFTFSQLQLKSEMKEMIRSGLLSDHYLNLTFPASQFASLQMEDDEFVWNNDRYDIVKIVTAGSHVVITCIQDTKESALMNNAISYLGKDYTSSPKAAAGNNIISLLKLLQTVFVIPASDRAPAERSDRQLLTAHLPIYQIPGIVIFSPPPELSCS